MIRVGIIGGGGYTAGELIRILVHHPETELAYVQSSSQAGRPISDTHEDLAGETELTFSAEPAAQVDVIFLCSGHGRSRAWVETNPQPEHTAIIDLSTDYRMDETWVYGLPELNREAVKESRLISNPGCFATAIQLGLLPLAAAGELRDEVHVNAITGSTGAGQSPQATTHFSWRNNNISVYKPFQHQHLAEIGRSLRQAQGSAAEPEVLFVPVRGNFARGIFASLYTRSTRSLDELYDLYEPYYAGHPFTHVVRQNPHLKQVVNTNKCLLYLEKHGERVLIVSMIDNLLKGASGQAVQNMNLAFGLPEDAGLRLKAMAF